MPPAEAIGSAGAPERPARAAAERRLQGGVRLVQGMAERGGFEPPLAFTRPLFESGTINHSDTSPGRRFYAVGRRPAVAASRTAGPPRLGPPTMPRGAIA